MPLYYLDVFEMRAILRAQGYLLDGVCGGMEKLVDVNFILTADEATIRQWEKGLKIAYKSRLTLDQRKRVVISYIIGLGHIGEQEIRSIIGQYTPNHVDFDFLRGTISILVEGEIFDEENLLETLLRRIPAHLGLKISIHIRREFRQTIPFAQGGAAGSYFFLEPITQEHISDILPLTISQAATDFPRFAGALPIPSETIRTAIPFASGGRVVSEQAGEPPTPVKTIKTAIPFSHGAEAMPKLTGDTPSPEQTVRTSYKLWQGGTSTSDVAGDTPQVQGTAHKPVSVAQAAFGRLGIGGDTPKFRGASTNQENAAGGIYCHTHIKSKRID